ncbi:hypothetical protein AB0L64_18630 [Kribbella sp. NPDC051936]|uniref:hypothetical protein n=1 Tax=Kribbella sp. NPDC051936 TaxID=3154946 RepID=UPI003418BE30
MTVVARLSGDDPDAVVAAAAALGIELRPLHPGVQDAELSTWFTAGEGDAEDTIMVRALRTLPGVVSAYAKPPDEPAAGP